MLIRPAALTDARVLSELARATYADAFGHSMSPADLAAHLEQNLSPKSFERILEQDIVLIAEIDGRIVGYVQFGESRLSTRPIPNNDQDLRRLYVQRSFQNQGIGTQLMEDALAQPAMQKAEQILLDVWEHNHGAQRFYARYGFSVIGERKFVVASGAETSRDLIMVRRRIIA